MVKTVTVDWVITGYHKFRVKPNNGEYLRLKYEKDNLYDPYAILVLRKADDRVIGRVPANLCRCILKLKNLNVASKFKCLFTGQINQSKKPHYLTPFGKNKNGGHDRAGGGAILSCIYSFEVEDDNIPKMQNIIKENIPADQLGRFA